MPQIVLTADCWDLMVQAVLKVRERLLRATAALEKAGFVYRHAAGIDLFLDGPGGKARDAVHIVMAGEKVRPEYPAPAPDVDECATDLPFADESPATPARRVLSLEALVRMKLTSFRLKDRVHLQDLAGVGTIDESWCERLPAELARRLREILDNPNG